MQARSTDSGRFESQAITFAVPGGVSPRARAARWLVALAIVSILHTLAGIWVERHRRLNRDVDTVDVPVQVALLTPQRIEQTAGGARGDHAAGTAAPPAEDRAAASPATTDRHDALQAIVPRQAHPKQTAQHPVPKAPPHPARPDEAPATPSKTDAAQARANAGSSGATATPHGADAAPSTASAAAASAAAGSAPASAGAAASANVDANASATAGAASGASGATAGAMPGASGTVASPNGPGGPGTQATNSHGEKFALPPTADIQYDTFYNGMRNQPGTLRWATDGEHYQMVVSMSLPFVGTYSFTSEGRIDAFGLAPQRYVEQRGRRGADTTSFERDASAARITFTRSPSVLPLTDGAQDRFSMIMQLASLVRGNPNAYTPGVTRQFFVADTDSGEIWPVEMIGTETVRTARGFIEAKHFMRLPRREGDRRRIDVWLAPSLGYLPVRLVQTEPNGTEVELLWHDKLPPPDAPAVAADTTAGASGTRDAPPATPSGVNETPADSAVSGTPGISPADDMSEQSRTKP